MQYEEVLKLWGAKKIRDWYPNSKLDFTTVVVDTEFSEGYACCGGNNPDCYCSYAESPSARVIITADGYSAYIDLEDFDFVEILKELVTIANGNITD